MYKGIECKLYPNQKQAELIQMTFGHTRFIWNQMLGMLKERYQNNANLKIESKINEGSIFTVSFLPPENG